MSLTVRSINTPATTVAEGGKKKTKGRPYDLMPMTSESGSYEMVGSEMHGGSRIKLMDNLSDAAARKVMSEHMGQQSSITKFNSVVEFNYKPTFIKTISGLWLLVAGREPFAELYSVHTMRRARVI